MRAERKIEDLMQDLEDSIASPPAQDLRRQVMDDNRSKSYVILRDEGFCEDECGLLYTHLRELWGGSPVTFVELEKPEWSGAVAAASIDPVSKFMLRRGCDVFTAHLYERGGRWEFFAPDSSLLGLDRIDQLWQIVPKH